MSEPSSKSPSDTPTVSEAELPDRLLGKLKIEIPGYELLDEIARGGQATVYRARELTSGLTVAIKLLHAGPYANEASRQRLQREIAALKALNHPNIVCVIEAGQTGTGLDYLVMNYIEGRGLDEFWRDRKTLDAEADDPSKLLRLFQQICETMAAAHRKGITHRDLSPSNIRIDEHGVAHILDFGLASTAFDGYLTPGGQDLSITGQFIGKLAYASPEQAKGDRGQIDIRTDVYALGVILYQILTHGAFPYEVVGNLVDVLNNIIHSKPTPPSEIIDQAKAARVSATVKLRKKRIDPAAINATIEAIVLKALEKDPDHRYQSAGELAREIEQYLRGKPLSAAPVTNKPKPSRRRLKVLIATTSIVIVLGAFMYGRTIAAWLGMSSLVAAATSQPSTQPAEAPGRIEFKTIELASTETSIDAINKSLKAAGYAVVVANTHANQYGQGNIDMNRNGGGPVDWRSFYGKTVKDFSSTNIVGNRQAYKRPPQFNYIYQANSQEKAKLEKDVNLIGKQIDALLERRRQLESNQLSLWATIAWQAVDDRGIALEPTVRYRPKSVAGNAARLQSYTAVQDYLLAENAALETGLEDASADPAKALAALNDSTKSAYNTFRAAMADASGGLTDPDDQKTAAQFSDTAKHLFDLTRNAVDAQKLALERDQAKDDQGKNTFRGQLQAAIFDSCTAVCSLDDQLSAAAAAWSVDPDRARPLAGHANAGQASTPANRSNPSAIASGDATANVTVTLLSKGVEWKPFTEGQEIWQPGPALKSPPKEYSNCQFPYGNAQLDAISAKVDQPGNVIIFVTPKYRSGHGAALEAAGWKELSSMPTSTHNREPVTSIYFYSKPCVAGEQIDFKQDNRNPVPRFVVPIKAASAQPSADTAIAALVLGSKWVGTKDGTLNGANVKTNAKVTSVKGRSVFLRVSDELPTNADAHPHEWKLIIADDGSITCNEIKRLPGGPGNVYNEVNMKGRYADGVLRLDGTLFNGSNHVPQSPTLSLRIDDGTTTPFNGTSPTH